LGRAKSERKNGIRGKKVNLKKGFRVFRWVGLEKKKNLRFPVVGTSGGI